MATVTEKRLLTAEDLLAMPDDGVRRWLIQGQLREEGRPGEPTMTVRNRWHSRILIRVGFVLEGWLEQQSAPRGQVLGGEAGVRLSRDPESIVGIDVVYVSAEVASRQTDETTLIDGVPVLVVAILSPSTTHEQIHDKLREYRRVGVPLTWVIDPDDRTVRVYRAGARPVLFNDEQELTAEPHLPGFRVAVARLFE
jgi:Uma2 family endonuclease